MQRECQNCGRLTLALTAYCPYCKTGAEGGSALAVVPSANDNWTEDKKPDGTTYRTVIGRGSRDRDVDYAHLARILPDMLIGEASYGIGVDVLAEQWPWVYSRSALWGRG